VARQKKRQDTTATSAARCVQSMATFPIITRSRSRPNGPTRCAGIVGTGRLQGSRRAPPRAQRAAETAGAPPNKVRRKESSVEARPRSGRGARSRPAGRSGRSIKADEDVHPGVPHNGAAPQDARV